MGEKRVVWGMAACRRGEGAGGRGRGVGGGVCMYVYVERMRLLGIFSLISWVEFNIKIIKKEGGYAEYIDFPRSPQSSDCEICF